MRDGKKTGLLAGVDQFWGVQTGSPEKLDDTGAAIDPTAIFDADKDFCMGRAGELRVGVESSHKTVPRADLGIGRDELLKTTIVLIAGLDHQQIRDIVVFTVRARGRVMTD